MGKRIFLVAAIYLIQCSINAQNEVPDQPFIKLKNGEVHKGNALKLNKKLFDSSVDLDNMNFKFKELTFYKGTDNELYGRIRGNFHKSIHQKDNMNIFRVNGTNTVQSSGYPGAPASHQPGTTTVATVAYYFNRGLNEIKTLNATNLLNEFKDNEEANSLIIRANKQKKIANIAFGAAVAGVVAYPLMFRVTANRGLIGMVSAVPIGGLITFIVFNNQKWKSTNKALKVYTGFDKKDLSK